MDNNAITRALSLLPGSIGFYYEDLMTGDCLAYHADDGLESASVIKLTVMAEAYRQCEAGLLSLNQLVRIEEQDKLPSCGALTYMHTDTYVLADLITLMIIVSDNTATNKLIDMLGLAAINRQIERMGMTHTRLARPLFRPDLAAQGLENRISARDAALFLKKLYQGEIVSPSASAAMLQHLKDQRLNGKIPFYLHGYHVAVAHKTGEDSGITNDVALVYAPRPFILCFLGNQTDVPAYERLMQDLSRDIYLGQHRA